jgi:nucleoside-diphosphate-sugar epimerase
MKALVTGATGFIGSHLVDVLLERNCEVRAMARTTSARCTLARGAQTVIGDVRDPGSLTKAAQGVDIVFHCAAHVGEWGAPGDYYDINVTGMKNMIDAAAAAGVARFMDVSSVAVHSNHNHDHSTEDALIRKSGVLYNDSKVDAEKLVWAAHEQGRIRATTIRPVMVWGPRDRIYFPKMIHALRKRVFAYMGSPDSIAGLAHVRNVVDIIVRAAENEDAVGQAFIAADGCETTVRDIVEALCAELNLPRPLMTLPYGLARTLGAASETLGHAFHVKKAPLLTKMGVELMGNNLSFSIEKAKRVLGFEPQHRFPESLPGFLEWYQNEYKA